MANPFVAFLAAIAAALMAMKKALESTAEGQQTLNRLSQAFSSVLGPILATVEKVAVPLFNGFAFILEKVGQGFNKFAQLLGIAPSKIKEATLSVDKVQQDANAAEQKRQEELTRKHKDEADRRAANAKKAALDAQAELKRLAEEEFIGAYGGKVNPKKYPTLNRAKGGYVHNQMTQPMLAEGGPIYGDPASEYTYAMGGMYGDPYARGGQIDYTNDMYAGGGPMVSNVKQPFNGPTAQNRGGMYIYADGGMMPPQEQQMMQEQQMQQQAPQEQMQQQSGQDQMMQMVQQIAQAIMKGANPKELMAELEGSGMPPEQIQQVMQVAMQVVDQQQQQQPQQQMAPPQQMMAATGGRLPKEILRARAEAHMSPEKAANYVDNYAMGGKMYYEGGPEGPPYMDEYGNLIGNSIINLREKTEPVTSLNRLGSNYFDTSNSYNPNPLLPNNKLQPFPNTGNIGAMTEDEASMYKPFSPAYQEEIDYTKMPYDKPLNLTGWKTPKPAAKIPGPISPNTIGPNGPLTEAQAIAQGYKPQQAVTPTTPTTPTPTPGGSEGMSAADWGTMIGQLAGPAHQFFLPKLKALALMLAK